MNQFLFLILLLKCAFIPVFMAYDQSMHMGDNLRYMLNYYWLLLVGYYSNSLEHNWGNNIKSYFNY